MITKAEAERTFSDHCRAGCVHFRLSTDGRNRPVTGCDLLACPQKVFRRIQLGRGCPAHPPRFAPADRQGPGTELLKIIPDLFHRCDCDCDDYAAKMDRWGVAGCERRFDRIVDHLCRQAESLPILGHATTLHRPIAQHWVRLAIERSRDERTANQTRKTHRASDQRIED